MTPMFSAYVVVGDPPNADASAVPTPSPNSARPREGSRSSPFISETAFTFPEFSAMSATTLGSTSRMNVRENAGPWKPGTGRPLTILSPSGRPSQGAEETLSQLMRSCATGLQPAPPHDVIGP